MNPILVLYLDTCRALPSSSVWVSIGLSDLGRTCEIDATAWCHNVYSPSPDELESLKRVALRKTYDLVIVGNNNGSGIDVVAALPSQMRSKVIVVTNVLPLHPSEDREYRRLGVTEFSERHCIHDSTERLLGIK